MGGVVLAECTVPRVERAAGSHETMVPMNRNHGEPVAMGRKKENGRISCLDGSNTGFKREERLQENSRESCDLGQK